MVGGWGIGPDYFRWAYLMIISLGLLHVACGQEVIRSTDAELNETYKTWSIVLAVLSMVTLAAVIVLAGFFFMIGKGDREKSGRRAKDKDKGVIIRTHRQDDARTLIPPRNQPTSQHSQPRPTASRHQSAKPLPAQGWPHRDVTVQPLVDIPDDQADQPTPSTSIEDYERDLQNYRYERDLREAQRRMARDQAGNRPTTQGWHQQDDMDAEHADQQSTLHFRYEADLQDLEENRDAIFNPEFLQNLEEYMHAVDPAQAAVRYQPRDAAPVIRRSFLPALPAPQTAATAPVYSSRDIPIGVGAVRDVSGAYRPATSIYGGGSRGTASVSYNPTAVSPDPRRTSSVLY